MPKDDLADDLHGDSGPRGIGRGMASKVVGPEIDPHQVTCLSDYDPRGGIGEGEYSLVSCDALGLEVILNRSASFLGMKTTSDPFPLLGFLMVSF